MAVCMDAFKRDYVKYIVIDYVWDWISFGFKYYVSRNDDWCCEGLVVEMWSKRDINSELLSNKDSL